MTKLFYTIIASVSLVFVIVCVNLNSRINDLNTKVSDLEWTVQEHELSIQRLAEKNNAQDVILNKLNSEYQMRERQRAEELKEAAERNGVGG
jgi:cell division protein FtsL